MKSVFVMALMALNTAPAFAHPEHAPLSRVYGAPLTSIQLDPRLSTGRPISGTVLIDHDRRTAALQIEFAFQCPPGRICAQVMPQPLEVELPLVSRHTDACGVTTYVAQYDARPADGALGRLTITDHSGNTCPIDHDRLAPPATQAVYETAFYSRMSGEEITTRSTFHGTRRLTAR